jgi:hypothetical protein
MTGCVVNQKRVMNNYEIITGVTDQVDITGVTGQIDITNVKLQEIYELKEI